jgi:hypothetical protein
MDVAHKWQGYRDDLPSRTEEIIRDKGIAGYADLSPGEARA